MSDLLSPSESHEFHSFLSSIDYNAANDARSISSAEWHNYSGDGIPIPQPPHGKGKEALAKATKDLMSLDSSSWGASPAINSHGSYNLDSHPSHSTQHGLEESQHSIAYHPQPRHSIPTSVSFPYLTKQRPFPSPSSLGQSRSDPSVAPIHATNGVNKSTILPTSSSSASSFSSRSSNAGTSNSALPSAPSSDTLPTNDTLETKNRNKKRTLDSSTQSSNKRHRPSSPSMSGTTKSTLLSPLQKKANHIQSEQKRRANIRRGYEALCETVPALREAIKQEHEIQPTNGVNGSKKPRRGRGRAKVDEGTGEKIDGRAGPRSESIVLVKTIDYINELLRDRESLLTRLRRVNLSLGPNQSYNLTSNSAPPLWERAWNGGSGKDADAEDDDEDEDEDDE
ncbi:hypothetical protein E1B28_011058 [Marasmius oreades]|uniref:BHLH domain-containing protein n=1 Tax=Marasmius oreades TaxID=181124 RepID=A0A9P7RUN5_9AGAR|nr:uncharacterized protein E1B28_011058 [Marasmius oreades]KAG7089368.1 hypothetical protein E1B28_011058 [Marasmius oreades]